MPAQITYTMDPDRGVAGQVNLSYPHVIHSGYSNEASAEVPFGTAVKGDVSVASGQAYLQPTTENDAIQGIVCLNQAYENGTFGELGTTGVKPGGVLNVLKRGRILVKCHTGSTAFDRLWVRAVSSGSGGERLGNCENADDSTDTIDCTKQGQFSETVAAEGLVWLDVDFVNK